MLQHPSGRAARVVPDTVIDELCWVLDEMEWDGDFPGTCACGASKAYEPLHRPGCLKRHAKRIAQTIRDAPPTRPPLALVMSA